MAKTVYTSEDIQLQDGTQVTLRPLVIGRLRKFLKIWNDFTAQVDDDPSEDDIYGVYINCAGVALEKDLKERVERTLDSETVLTDEYRELLEDILDMDTIFKILEVCGGLKLNDPKLLEEAQRRVLEAQTAASSGKT